MQSGRPAATFRATGRPALSGARDGFLLEMTRECWVSFVLVRGTTILAQQEIKAAVAVLVRR